MEIRQCPIDYVGTDMIDAANLASISGKGDWPIHGGLLDQSSWFVDMYQRLKAERSRIESERASSGGQKR